MKKETSILEAIETKISLKLKDNFDPQEYFKDRKGLYVFNSFIDRISSKAKPVKKGTSYTLDSFKILKYSTNEKIENSLPKKHIFTESEVCAVIAELIEKKPKGEDGLLDTGYWNLFYTPNFVVHVRWRGGVWGVGAWGRGDDVWSGNGRVFSPATGK